MMHSQYHYPSHYVSPTLSKFQQFQSQLAPLLLSQKEVRTYRLHRIDQSSFLFSAVVPSQALNQPIFELGLDWFGKTYQTKRGNDTHPFHHRYSLVLREYDFFRIVYGPPNPYFQAITSFSLEGTCS